MKRLVLWGGREDLSSHRHIHRAFYETAGKLGIPALWLRDEPRSRDVLHAGDTVLSADIFGKHLPYVPEVSYVLHNFSGDAPLCQALEENPERLLRLQVWTDAASGETWDECRSFDREARTLFQPWGCDLLAAEFLPPAFNPESRDVVFVGAVWSDQHEGVELGNEAVIAELREVCAARGLTFTHRTHVPDSENVRLVREARLAPALAGAWQCGKGYVPCRALKHPAYGAAMLTNVPAVNALFGDARVAGESPAEIIDAALTLGRADYCDLVREQQQVVARYTYREGIESIERAFAEIAA